MTRRRRSAPGLVPVAAPGGPTEDRWGRRLLVACVGAFVVSGCGGEQSALRGDGTRAEAINENTLVLTVLGGAVWVIVVVAVLVAAFRRNREKPSVVDRRGIATVLVAGVILPAVIIVVVTAHSIGVLNRIEAGLRAYDPCLSCSTHALGQMPMLLQLVAPDGEVVCERRRD